jgi:hypothetical protein
MAEATATRPDRARGTAMGLALGRVAALPGWLLALVAYLLTRLIVTVFTLVAADRQLANLWTPQSPSYADFVSMWDGDRYRVISEQGYPVPLPVDALGAPTQSEWAFFPAYPAVVRLVREITGLGFDTVASTLSFVFGCAAAVVVYQLFRGRASRGTALTGVVLLGVFPTAAVLQYSYSESLCLLALTGALLLLTQRRYLAAMTPVVVLGLVRPVGVPMVLVVVVHLVLRWRDRDGDRFGLHERLSLLGLLAVSAGSALAWPTATAVAAGRLDGYTAVQVAWRVSDRMEYFTPWLWMSRYLFDGWGPVVLLAIVAGLVVVLTAPVTRRLGPEMWTWCAGYALYLAAVLDPFTSLFRFLVLLFPLALVVAWVLRPLWARLAWVAVSLVGQWWWVQVLWVFAPPSDYPP